MPLDVFPLLIILLFAVLVGVLFAPALLIAGGLAVMACACWFVAYRMSQPPRI